MYDTCITGIWIAHVIYKNISHIYYALSMWIPPAYAYNRGLSDHIAYRGDSDNSNSFITNGRNINLLEGDSDSES